MGLWDVYNQHFKNATFTDLTHEFFSGQPKFPALPDQTLGVIRPAPRHQGLAAAIPLPRPPSFNEADLTGKPR